MKNKSSEGKGIKIDWNIVKRGDMIFIEHSKTDSSGIGFSVNQLDSFIFCLQKIREEVINHPTHH